MSEKKFSDQLALELKMEMGEGKGKATISGFVKGEVAHAEVTFPSSRLPDLIKVIEMIGFHLATPQRTLPGPTKKP